MSDRPDVSFRVRLVASDLDGTLLTRSGEVSPRTHEALARARSAGVVVVAVTGRPPRWVDHLAPALGPGLAICANGAIVVDLPSGAVVEEHSLEPVVAREVVRRLESALPGAAFAVERGRDFAFEAAWVERLPPERAGAEIVRSLLDSREALTAEPVAKVLAWVKGERGDRLIERATEAVGDAAVVTASSYQELVEVSAPGVTKATTLARLCQDRGIDRADVVAFGDARNDVAMLDWAGWGVATADAHPAALAVADDVTDTCDHDGVAAWLERHLPEAAPAPSSRPPHPI
ncbi:MAG: HAD family phosphatase [Actinobacteria bacterium]|nr:HAD family phosphatase [Actinomycetota bacterium]